MTSEELTCCRYADIMDCNADNLVNLKQVPIPAGLPLPMRAEHYMNQVKNPYLFRIDDLIVKATFTGTRELSSVLSVLMAQS